MTFQIILATILVLLVLIFVRVVPRDAVVVDGDTIRVRDVSWRLSGFDAPEWNQPGGRQATAMLRAIVRRERSIAIVRSRDHYGRPLATILTLRGPVSWRMVVAGHAHGEGYVGGFLTGFAWVLRRGLWARRGRDEIVHPRVWRQRAATTGRPGRRR